MEQEDDLEQETDIEMVNINSINFNSGCSTIIAILKTSSNKDPITVPYKADMGSAENIMALISKGNNGTVHTKKKCNHQTKNV